MNNELKKILQKSIVEVKFTKVDGTERVMKCTLKEGVAPKNEKPSESKIRAVNDQVCPVWDLDLAAWRSFRWDSVKEYNVCE